MRLHTFLGMSGLLPYPNRMGQSVPAPDVSLPSRAIHRIHAPLTNHGSYPAVMELFINHWRVVNETLAKRGSPPLKLQGGYTLENLVADREELRRTLEESSECGNNRIIAGGERDQAKTALLERHMQLRHAIRAVLPGRWEANSLPAAPQHRCVQSRFLRSFYDLRRIWSDINALEPSPEFTPPLIPGGYTLAQFTADIQSLERIYVKLTEADRAAKNNHAKRDSLIPGARERMKQYANAVAGAFGRRHPLMASVPVLCSLRRKKEKGT